MAEKKVTQKTQGKKKDWVTPVAVVGGGAVLVVGAVLLFKKGPHVPPGGVIEATFKYKYNGDQGDYVLQVSLGHVRIGEWFDHIEGLTWTKEINLTEAGAYEEELECPLPEGIAEKTYDAEALIRTPEMSEFDYIVKLVAKSAIVVG